MKGVKGVKGMKGRLEIVGMLVGGVLALLCSAPIRGQEVPRAEAAAIPRLSLEEFRSRQAAVLVVDVRDELAFKVGHIPGAISVPLAQVEQRAGDIRARAGGKPIVTYCSCPSEQTAAAAAVTLSKFGVTNVSVLVGGYPEWLATGGAIERGGGPKNDRRTGPSTSSHN